MNDHSKDDSKQTIFFRQLPFFQSLTYEQKDWLKERIEFRKLNGKSLIYKPDESTSEIYLIQKGKIKTEVINSDGKVLIKRIGLSGDIFGEQALYEVEQRKELAWTLFDPVELYVIQVRDLKKLMRENFDFLQNVFKIIGEQIEQAESRVMAFSVRQARWRVIDFLKEMVKTQGQKIGYEWLIRHHMTQEEIGSYTGTGRQAVTETFSQFKSDNIIHYSRGRVLIRDLERLE